MKSLKTITILLVIVGLSFVIYQTVSKKKSSLSTNALSDFAVKDTASIDIIKLSDTKGNKLIFQRNESKKWTLSDGSCVQQHLIVGFLEAFKYISVKSPVGKNAVDNINKLILTTHKKVEIYQKGQLVKTWYIGNPTQDHYGTYMLLSDPEKGKSPEPFIMHLPNMYGVVADRFSTDRKEYLCSEIFTYNPKDIKEIELTIPEQPELNFKIVQNNEEFIVYNNTKPIEFDTLKVRKYLLGYKKIHFTNYNRTLPQPSVDSLRNSTPMYIIKVIDNNNNVNKIKAYKKGVDYQLYDLEGRLLVYDQDNLWVFTNDDKLTKCQYYVFDKLFRDINYFRK